MGNSKLKGLQEFINKTNKQVSLALQTHERVKRYLKWVPHPTQFKEPIVKFQNIERPIAIQLYGWTMEAVCMWVYELADFIQEEPFLYPTGMYYMFKNFDVDFYTTQGCYWKPTGRVIESRTEEKILVCD